jgi:hypothetical protein
MYWLDDRSISFWSICCRQCNSVFNASKGAKASRVRVFSFDADESRYARRVLVVRSKMNRKSPNIEGKPVFGYIASQPKLSEV